MIESVVAGIVKNAVEGAVKKVVVNEVKKNVAGLVEKEVLGQVAKATAGTIGKEELRTAARYLTGKGFKLPTDYKQLAKSFVIDGNSTVSRLMQIKEQLARVSSIEIGRKVAVGKVQKYTGDVAVSALRAIVAEGKKRQSATQFRKKEEYANEKRMRVGVDPKTGGTRTFVVGFDREKKDIRDIVVGKNETESELASRLEGYAGITTVSEERKKKIDNFRSNLKKGYINGVTGGRGDGHIEAVMRERTDRMSDWDIDYISYQMKTGRLGKIRSIDDMYRDGYGTAYERVIEMMNGLGIKFDELTDAERNDLALISETDLGQNADGSVDWSNLEQLYNGLG